MAAKKTQDAEALVKKLGKRQRKLSEVSAEIAALEAELVELTGAPAPAAKAKKVVVSPFAPAAFPPLPAVAGVRLAAGAAGVRYKGRTDVMLAELAPGSVMAGTFTRSETRSAPVLWCQERIAALAAKPSAKKLAIVVNSGNANACTGRQGLKDAREMTSILAAALQHRLQHVGRDLRVGEDEGQHGRHVRRDHAGALGDAVEDDRHAADLGHARGALRIGVGGHDRPRRIGPGIVRQPGGHVGQALRDGIVGQDVADDAG